MFERNDGCVILACALGILPRTAISICKVTKKNDPGLFFSFLVRQVWDTCLFFEGAMKTRRRCLGHLLRYPCECIMYELASLPGGIKRTN